MWAGNYTGLYPFPLMVLLAPISRLPLDTAAILWIAACLITLVLVLGRSSLYWMLFVPFLQGIFLGQIDPFFLPIYRSKRPAVWALLSLKPQLLLLALPKIFASRRNAVEFAQRRWGCIFLSCCCGRDGRSSGWTSLPIIRTAWRRSHSPR